MLPSEWGQGTHPGELMVRKALSFRSTRAETGYEKWVLGSHWSCPQLFHASVSPSGKAPPDPAGSPESLQSRDLIGRSPLKPLRPPGPPLTQQAPCWFPKPHENPDKQAYCLHLTDSAAEAQRELTCPESHSQ